MLMGVSETIMTVFRPNSENGPGAGSLVVLSTLSMTLPALLTKASWLDVATDWLA